MTAYRLKDDGYPSFKNIMRGRQRVGRVCLHAEGGYVGVIGTDSVRAPTEVGAFEEVAARAMGYKSASALHARNSRVRAGKRLYNQASEALATQVVGSDGRLQMDLIDKFGSTPQGLTMLLHGFTRTLKRRM